MNEPIYPESCLMLSMDNSSAIKLPDLPQVGASSLVCDMGDDALSKWKRSIIQSLGWSPISVDVSSIVPPKIQVNVESSDPYRPQLPLTDEALMTALITHNTTIPLKAVRSRDIKVKIVHREKATPNFFSEE